MLLLAVLSAFTHRPGGEGFEIYAGTQLLVQRFGNDMSSAQSLSLSGMESNSLFIKYFHCGQTGTQRQLTVKDAQQRTLKVFPFADSRASQGVMKLDITAIKALVKSKEPVQLYYSAAELTSPRMLTTITF